MHDENLKIVTNACRQDTIDVLPINKGEKLDFIGFDRPLFEVSVQQARVLSSV